jgi:tRNA dimethylallyltransferase
MDSRKQRVVAVLGPTASGKSDLALALAEGFCGEIVNCDSLQLYRGLEIGTAKTPAPERRGIPHHLFDLLEPDEIFSAGEYARQAAGVIREIGARGRLPILCGGTGFYVRALFHGLAPSPVRNDALRARLEAKESRRTGSLHRILGRIDPATAGRIHVNDRQKTVRALEICLLGKQAASRQFAMGRSAAGEFDPLLLALLPPRAELVDRIEIRSRRMFEHGILEEVRRLLEGGVASNAKAFESIGYKESMAVIRGECTLEEAIVRTSTATRQYAKRQITWLRSEPDVHWLEGFGDSREVLQKANKLVNEFKLKFT